MVGSVPVGGDSPISVQTMTNTDTSDIEKTVEQIHELENCGCDIIRVAIPDQKSARALFEIKNRVSIPIIADIHFDYKLAVTAIEYGKADGIRINRAILKPDKIEIIVNKAKNMVYP